MPRVDVHRSAQPFLVSRRRFKAAPAQPRPDPSPPLSWRAVVRARRPRFAPHAPLQSGGALRDRPDGRPPDGAGNLGQRDDPFRRRRAHAGRNDQAAGPAARGRSAAVRCDAGRGGALATRAQGQAQNLDAEPAFAPGDALSTVRSGPHSRALAALVPTFVRLGRGRALVAGRRMLPCSQRRALAGSVQETFPIGFSLRRIWC